jgi:c(7)-type cytochrome triheme protein
MKRLFTVSLLVVLVTVRLVPVSALELRDVTFRTKEVGTVIFSHNDHITKGQQKNNCRACHDKIFDIRHPVRHSMSDMEQGKSCGACHNGTVAFALADCVKCHPVKNLAIKVKETGPVAFTHQMHASRQSCTVCHPALFIAGKNRPQGMAAMEKGKSCGACHDGTKAFGVAECARCHTVTDLTFKVKETGPVLFTHTAHAGRQPCHECHPLIYRYIKGKHLGMAAMGKGKSCGACHNGTKAFAVAECAKCHPLKELTFPTKDISPARFSHKSHLATYGCKVCHPKLYPLKRGNPVGMAAMEKGKSCGTCHNGKSAFPVTASCGYCH